MKYQEVEGDLIALALEGKFDVIAHGCNCFCRQKRGLAPLMAKTFGTDTFDLESKKDYDGWDEDQKRPFYVPSQAVGNINKLGMIDYRHIVILSSGAVVAKLEEVKYNKSAIFLTVVNCYTQYHWSSAEHPKPFDISAFCLCMKKIAHTFKGQHIGLPLIGAGLAGGDWGKIQAAIHAYLVPHCDVTIVKLPH